MSSLAEGLKARDTDAEARLATIRHAMSKALERGRFGALKDMVPLDLGEEEAAAMLRRQEGEERKEKERWLTARRLRQQEREEAEEKLDDLFFAQHERLGEREALMAGVQTWSYSMLTSRRWASALRQYAAGPPHSAHTSPATGRSPRAALAVRYVLSARTIINAHLVCSGLTPRPTNCSAVC